IAPGRRSVRAAGEAVEGREHAGERDLKDCAIGVCTAISARSVEVTIAGLDQASPGNCAIGSVEGVECSESASARDPKDRADAVGATLAAGSVEVAVAGLEQAREGNTSTIIAVG